LGTRTSYVPADAFLKYRDANTIRVVARAHDDSRWYSGIGIHRDTWIIVKELVHVALDGVKIATPDVDAERAVVMIATTVQNDSINTQTESVATDIRAVNDTAVASDTTPATLLPGRARGSAAAALRRCAVAVERRPPHPLYRGDCRRTPAHVLDEERTRFARVTPAPRPAFLTCVESAVVGV
jgi:hypothetical protein